MSPIQNKSSAVMNRREAGSTASLDFFPTPPWATRALCERIDCGSPEYGMSCWEPCCGAGHMVYALEPYFKKVIASDLHDYGYGYRTFDATKTPLLENKFEWIITNPPFNQAQEIAERMLPNARVGLAMLLRLNWLESAERYALFCSTPPTDILVFSERVPMQKNVYNPKGSTATCYAWFIWEKDDMESDGGGCGYAPRGGETEVFWIPPGTKNKLSKPEDLEVTEGYRARL